MYRVDVCYIADNNYAKYAGVSITSLLSNIDRDVDMRIHVISDGIEPDNVLLLDKICSRHNATLNLIDAKSFSVYRNINANDVYPRSTYLKLMLDVALAKEKIKKVLYIDCDTIIVKSIKALYAIDIGHNVLGGAIDIMPGWKKTRYGLKSNSLYINTGVMLVDLENWKETNCSQKLKSVAMNDKYHFQSADQDIINIGLKDQIHPISIMYNYTSHYKNFKSYLYYSFFMKCIGSCKIKNNEFYMARHNYTILHYTGERPWYKNISTNEQRDYLYYLNKSGFATDLDICNIRLKLLNGFIRYTPLPIYYFLQWVNGRSMNFIKLHRKVK